MLFETSTVYVVCIRCQHRKERKMKDLKKYTFKTLAVFLSILMIVYLVPTFVFAEWIDGLSSGASGENDEPAGRASDTYEMTERREENVKHFHCPDGTNIAVQYDMPVHYLDNGEWKDIDNTLAASGNDYSTSNARIKFAKKITGNESLFTLHDGNRKIVMSLDGARKKTAGKVTSLEKETDATETKLQKLMRLDKLSSKITYENILDGTDLEYIVFSSNVKENIIVKKKLPSYLYTFTISLNNLTAAVCGDGSVRIYDPTDDETVYVIPRGYMVDADGARSDAVSYSVSDLGNGKYKFTVTADADWINSDGRAFPVEIDPSLNADSADCVDVDFSSDSPSTSCDTDLRLFIGGPWHAAWKTNTLPELPEYAYITNVKFALYCQYTGNNCIGIYKITSDWDGSLNWSRLTDSSEGVPDTDPLDYNMFDEDTESGRHSWDITDLARSWYDGTEENYGVFLQDVEEFESLYYTIFFSSNNPDVTLHPQLIVTYRDQLGVEDYWSFISQKAGSAGVGSLNLANGNLVFSIGTLTSTDSLMPFTPTLIYNSMLTKWYYTRHSREVPYNYATVAGGFKTNINQCIVPRTYINENQATETFYVYTDADGTEHAFFRSTKSDESNIYYDEDGLKLKLTVYESEYTITDPDFNVYTFTRDENNTSYTYAGGYLTQITDVNGNTVAFDCNSYGRPTAVKLKPNGASSYTTQLEIYYRTSGVISYILNPATQQAVHLFYSADYNTEIAAATRYLRKIVVAHQKDGNTSADNWLNFRNNDYDPHIEIDAVYYYDYDSVGHLRSITDDLNEVNMYYTYDSAGRVISVSEWGRNSDEWQEGQTVNITYGTGYTEVETSGEDDDITTEDDNIITRYVFDNEGRCVSCYSTDKAGNNIYGMSSGVYETDKEKAKNSLKTSSVISCLSTNYLINGNFESRNGSVPMGWTVGGNVAYQPVTAYNKRNVDYDYLIRMTPTSATPAILYQQVYLTPGTYTLSADVISYTASDAVVKLQATQLPDNQKDTETISFNQQYVNDENAEASLTFNIKTAGTYTMKLTVTGGSYVEVSHMTLSKTVGVSAFNKVQNGSFELNNSLVPTYWTPADTSTPLSVASGGDFPSGYALKVNGFNLTTSSYAEQTIFAASASEVAEFRAAPYNVTSKQYRISARGRATSIIANELSTFGIRVIISYITATGSRKQDETMIPFNKYTSQWQLAEGVFSTQSGSYFVESIKIRCEYNRQNGTAYFDDVAMCYVGNDPSVAQYLYNDDGMPIMVQSGYSYKWYQYDGNNVVAAIDRRNVIIYSYSNNILRSEQHYNFSGDVSKEYCGYTQQSAKTLVAATTYIYNAYGQLVQTTYTAPYDMSLTEKNTYVTDSGSRIFGALKSSTNAQGEITRYFYDEDYGYLMATIDANGNGMTYSYDALGRMTSAYPAQASGGLYEADEESASVAYSYDELSRLDKIITESTEYSFAYDDFGNKTSVSAGSKELASYVYNDYNGKLREMTYSNGLTVKYTYDELDRVKEVQYNTGSGTSGFMTVYTYEYDANGNVSKIADVPGGQTTVFKYNSRGKLVSYYVTDENSGQSSLSYWYDSEGRIAGWQYDRELSSYTATLNSGIIYDNDNGLVNSCYTTVDSVNFNTAYIRDKLRRTSQVVYSIETDGIASRQIRQQYSYMTYCEDEDMGLYYDTPLISTVTTTLPSGSIETLNYTYDAKGNITEISDGTGSLYRYKYDSLGQLIREDNRALSKTCTWEYDNAGNILNCKTYAYTTGTLGSAQYTISYGYSSGSWGDLLTSYWGNSITYDGVGNPLTWGDYGELTWQGRRLMSYSDSESGDNYSYTYNADGIRTSKTVNDVKHIYHLSGTQILSEEWTEDRVQHILIFVYDDSGQPIGMSHFEDGVKNGDYLFAKNVQGDITAVYDANGTCLVTYTYDAWGNTRVRYSNGGASTAARYNPLRYRGYYYDIETGFYLTGARYYDPEIGRFINADGYVSTGQGVLGNNMFAYCGNNPVNRADSTGMIWKEIGDIFSKAWNGIKTWAKNTFGAGSSTTATIAEIETPVIPDPSPITVKTGTKTTQTISKHGDSSKPISVYANKDAQHPIKSSSAGININIANFTLDLSVGLDDIGLSGALTNGNTTNSFGVKLNLSELKIGFEGSTAIQWDNTTETAYTNASISGWAIAAAYILVTTGQYVQSPSYAY